MSGPEFRDHLEVRVPGPGHETTQLVIERLRGWVWLSIGGAGAGTVLLGDAQVTRLIELLTRALAKGGPQ